MSLLYLQYVEYTANNNRRQSITDTKQNSVTPCSVTVVAIQTQNGQLYRELPTSTPFPASKGSGLKRMKLKRQKDLKRITIK